MTGYLAKDGIDPSPRAVGATDLVTSDSAAASLALNTGVPSP